MALINCPICGKPISDKAVKCPHCGIVLVESNNKVSELNKTEEIDPSITEKKQAENTPNKAISITKKEITVDTTKEFDILIVITSFLGAVSAIVPLFFDVYGIITRPIPSLMNAPSTPLFLTAMGIAIIGCVLCLVACVYGIIRVIKKAQPHLLFWVSSVAIALIASFGTFWTAYYASRSFDSLYNTKVDAARGTYEWVSKEDGTTTSFSMCYEGFVEYHGKLGKVTHFGYDYEHDKLGVGIYVDGEESFGWYDADMKYVETASGKVSVKKVSDSTFSLEEWLAKKQEAEKQAALEEAKNFCTKDLSAFMLHGKVKTVTYHSGRSFSRCTFNELGSLIKYEIGDNHSSYQYQITHDGNKLLLGDELGTWGEVYEVNDENRLVKYECGGDGVGSRNLYYYHDSNNCPRVEKVFSYDMYDNSWQEGETRKLTYSDIDEYGNWLTKTDHNDEILERRIIEYYSMDK